MSIHRIVSRRSGAAVRHARLIRGAVALLAAAALGACNVLDRALEVEAPGLIDASDMNHPQNAHLLVSGTISDFDCALGAYIVNSAVLGNELRDASVTAARFPLDQRNIDDSSPYGTNTCAGSPPGIYRPISTAIWTSNNALTKLKAWTDAEVANRTNLIAQAAAYGGYSHVLMGEGFCSAVITELGPEVTSRQVFEAAEALFTEAIAAAQAAGNNDMRHMALVGRARTRLNLGDNAGAAADARALLASSPQYVKNASASQTTARRFNRVAAEFFGRLITVDSSYFNLTVEGVADPRVRVVRTVSGTSNIVGADGFTPLHHATKYGQTFLADMRNTPVPIAHWREAQLIIAEAEGGQEAVNRINVLRTSWNLPAYPGGTPDQVRAQVIQERARELFLEGHHLNDLRRFNIANTPAPGAAYRQGGVYGSARCFPLPAVEKNNNPNFR